MIFSTSNIATVLALSGATSAHMIMANPKPYGSPDNSPLTASNYPCKLSGDPATFYSTDGLSNTATAGDSVKMSFTGSAVHGGGSCQVALTTDMQPSASTRWSVILSIEGGCPSKDGSGPSEYDVKIPADIPAGDYSYAWTWTSKLSGQPEYYMNCAPLTIQGGSGSKSRRALNIHQRADALDAYPPLAVYNLADINSCKSVLSSSPQYPVPGDNVEKLAASDPNLADITGDNCFAKDVTFSGGSSSGGSSSGGSSDSGSGSGSSGSGSGSGSASTPATPSATGSPAGAATSAAAAPATPTGSGSSSSSGSSSGSGSSTGSGSSSGSGSTDSTGGGSCTEGESECSSDGTSYKTCVAGGEWSASMSVAAGTKCTPGTSTSLNIVAASKKRGFPVVF